MNSPGQRPSRGVATVVRFLMAWVQWPVCKHPALWSSTTGSRDWAGPRRASRRASTATITASYLDDALGDLLEAVGVLLEGAEEA